MMKQIVNEYFNLLPQLEYFARASVCADPCKLCARAHSVPHRGHLSLLGSNPKGAIVCMSVISLIEETLYKL